MSINKLPNEILFKIMQYLRLRDRLRARRVCKRWNQILCEKLFMQHADLLKYRLHLNTMWTIVRYHISPDLLTLKIRGYAYADDSNKGKPSVSNALLRELSTHCPNLWLLHLTECRISSISFEYLPPSITCLEMVSNKWRPRWMYNKQMHLPKLEHLNLDESERVGDHDLYDIAFFKNLKYLSLNRCYKIGVSGVIIIAENLLMLEVLNLSHTSVDNIAVYYIALHLKKLKELCLDNCRQLTNSAVYSIAKELPELNMLDISYCEEITMTGLESLFVSNLSVLIARHMWYRYSEEARQNFKRGFPDGFTLKSF